MENINTLIKLNEVKAQLNLMEDFDLDDALLLGYIETSLEVAKRHIGKEFSDIESTNTIPFNASIKVGCLMYIAHLYANREITTDTQQTVIPMTIKALWDVYREPCVH